MAHRKMIFLVLPKVHLLDLAGAVQVFHEAIEQGADFSIHYCSYRKDIAASANFPIGNLQHYEEMKIQEDDFLFIPGAEVDFLTSRSLSSEKGLINWVKGAHEQGAYICSVCTGAFFLGLTGLLNGRKCTTHWKRTAQLKQRYPAIQLMEDILFAEDDRIYTSAGVTAGIDMALAILSKLTDEAMAYKIARELVVYLRRTGSESQQSIFVKYRNHIHTGIHRAQDFLQGNIQKKISLVQLADAACMSSRNLTRNFKRETGITVNEYTTQIRQELLRSFSRNPDMSRKQMAQQCGLKSERQVIRLLRAASRIE